MDTFYYIVFGIALLAVLIPGNPILLFFGWLGNRVVQVLTFGARSPEWRRGPDSLVPRSIGLFIVAVLVALLYVTIRR